jgi:hypothetical protein
MAACVKCGRADAGITCQRCGQQQCRDCVTPAFECPCGDLRLSNTLCQFCARPGERECDDCGACVCDTCAHQCTCGSYLDDAQRCNLQGCADTTTPGQRCPYCRRAYHDKCVRACRWCDFAVAWTCDCGEQAFDRRARRWASPEAVAGVFTACVSCPHGDRDTETVFTLREKTKLRWRTMLSVVITMCVLYGFTFFVIGDQCAADQVPTWCVPVAFIGTAVGFVPVVYYYYQLRWGIPRRWLAQQSKLVKCT